MISIEGMSLVIENRAQNPWVKWLTHALYTIVGFVGGVLLANPVQQAYEPTAKEIQDHLPGAPPLLILKPEEERVRVGDILRVVVVLVPRKAFTGGLLHPSCGKHMEPASPATLSLPPSPNEALFEFSCRALSPGDIVLSGRLEGTDGEVRDARARVLEVAMNPGNGEEARDEQPSRTNLSGKWYLKLASGDGELQLTHNDKGITGTFKFTMGVEGHVKGLADGGKALLTLAQGSTPYGELDGTIGGSYHMLEISGVFTPSRKEFGDPVRFLATRGGPGSNSVR